MSKHIWKIWIPVTTLIILIVAYGLFCLWQYRTHSVRLDQAITSIIDRLSADPNYIVTERIAIKTKEPNFSDLSYLLDYLNQSLQVCVRKATNGSPPNWGIQLDKMFKQFPRFLRPSRDLYLYSIEDNWIGITAVEPTTEELQKLERKVKSLDISRDIRIDILPFYLERERMKRELLNH